MVSERTHTDNASEEPSGNGMLGGWTGPAIGLMDLDAFFASVEQLDDPALRGKPVIVGSPSSE